jgi:hypothetical protein
MNKLLAAVLVGMLAFSTVSIAEDNAAPKTKKVCVDQKDPKTGKVNKVCKTIKIHKKFEGTKVPEKAPKK